MLYKSLQEFKTQAGYEIDGAWYPRVTSILSIKSKPALYMYYASMPSYKAAQEMTDKSALEGTLIHETIEAILQNKPVTIPPSIQPSVDAFTEFLKKHSVTPLKVEERIISKKHRYAGTIDILAEVDGVTGVLDIKTSRAVYRDYGMQTAAYIEALAEDTSLPPLTSWVLRIDQKRECMQCGAEMREKGGVQKVKRDFYPCVHHWSEPKGEYEFKEMDGYDHNIKAFLAAKTLWEWEHHNHLVKLL